MNIPATLQIGDTWEWDDSLSDYPAPTYTLKYALRKYGLSIINITASADGTDHAVSVAAATTAGYVAGDYSWSAFVETGSGDSLERYTVGSGTTKLLPALFAAKSTDDNRSHAQKMLDAIEATMEGRASHAELSLTVNGKAIQYFKPAELIQWRSFYRSEVQKEKQEERIAQGLGTGKRILTRFGP